MAPPMAAEALGRPAFTIADLSTNCAGRRPAPTPPTPPTPSTSASSKRRAGCARHWPPMATVWTSVRELAPDLVVLVADAGLGTINSVRLTADAIGIPGAPVVVVLNRFDATIDLHVRNLEWLRTHDGMTVVTSPGERPVLRDIVTG